MDRERRALNARLGAEPRRLGKAGDEFGAAIGIAGIVERINPDEHIARPRRLGAGRGQRQEHQIARGHIGDGDIIAHPALGHVDRIGQRRSAEGPQVQSDLGVAHQPQPRGNPAGGFQLQPVALAVIHAERMNGKALLPREGRRDHRIKPARKQDNRNQRG